MSRSSIPVFLVAALVLVAGGWVLALVVDPAPIVGLQRAGAAGDEAHEHHDDAHQGHVHLTESAFENLDLRMRPVKLASGTHKMQIPGEIVERPGQSDHALASPVNGVVTKVYALPGQAIRPGDALFKLQVIDEALTTAQLNLLGTIARLITVEAELKRIGPLADAGTVLGRKKLELEYEQTELQLKQRLYEQELEVRGLAKAQVAKIKRDKELVRELIVRMQDEQPAAALPDAPPEALPRDAPPAAPLQPPIRPVSATEEDRDWEYTIEELRVFPGKSVARGEDLCHIAYHTVLYIQGQVFENELPHVLKLGEGSRKDWTVTAIFGSQKNAPQRPGLRVHYVDNHVDEQTQTYMFYVPLRNDVIRDTVDDDGRRFRTWRFKPGQRVHLRVPSEPYENVIRLPPEAVVIEGASAYVFREVPGHDDPDHEDHGHEAVAHDDHDHAHAEGEADAHGHSHSHGGDDEELRIDLERVPVEVEYQDSEYVLVSPGGQLHVGDLIAMNNAYRLFLEQKSQSGGPAMAHGHEH